MTLRTSILLAVTACGGVSSAPDHPSWSVDHVMDDGGLLGVWGTGADDVWAVGGQTTQGMILHGDGRIWTPANVNAPAILFSVYGFSRTDVYAVGADGLILHFDGTTWTRIASGTTMPLFGLWGASGDDVWIVGGDMARDPGSAVVLRGNKHGFAPVPEVAQLAPDALFKVHGFGADNIIVVGKDGVLHWDGATWSRDALPTTAPLFSTWGVKASDCYAVGGSDVSEILHSDGTQWKQAFELPVGFGLRGVFSSQDQPTIAVGESSLAFEIDGTGSIAQAVLPDLGPATFLHAVWGDGAGTTYVAASDYPRAMTGMILRRE